ncbi:hypothetical protein CTI12_AA504670 [Artemisia annua]|uniref:Uncharacterized protein n=1 Tax=Artemisia annua TaxID=35608 RepID=A0A2U1LD82_ARTAN|nr:hypothetical protein CTI12_AA504670 [Artemisia annua]
MLRPSPVDPPGRNENEPHRRVAVRELERAVVMSKRVAVRVSDRDELEEGEVYSVVLEGKGRELDGVDGYFGGFGFEDDEIDDGVKWK